MCKLTMNKCFSIEYILNGNGISNNPIQLGDICDVNKIFKIFSPKTEMDLRKH